MNWHCILKAICAYFVVSLLGPIQLTTAENQNMTKSSKTTKRSFDFPPIFYPGPDNKFITVAPPPQLPNNLKVLVNNLGSPEITTFRPHLHKDTQKQHQQQQQSHFAPSPPTRRPHRPNKFLSKPRKTTPAPFKPSSRHPNHSTNRFPSSPTPHHHPTAPMSSTARPHQTKAFRHQIQPTTFRPNSAHFFQDFRPDFRPEFQAQTQQSKRPKPPFHPQKSQGLSHADISPTSSLDFKQSRNRNPYKPDLPPSSLRPFPIPPFEQLPDMKQHHSSKKRPFRPEASNTRHPAHQTPSAPPWTRRPILPPSKNVQSSFGHSHPPVYIPENNKVPRLQKPNTFTATQRPNVNDDITIYKQHVPKIYEKRPMKPVAPSHFKEIQEHRPNHMSYTRPIPTPSNIGINNMNSGYNSHNIYRFNHNQHHDNSRFSCQFLQPGYYADVNTGCEMFHICHHHRQFAFTCPKGTLFSQKYLICDWANRVACSPFSMSQHKEFF